MVWKPKERELTEEEAVEQAIKELKPQWLHSEPLFAVVYEGEGRDDVPLGEPKLFPLEKNFRARRWLLFFFDPTSFLDRSVHLYLRDLVKRYAQQAVTPLVVLPERPPFLADLPRIDHFLRSLKLDWVVVADVGSRIAQAFGVTQSPTLILLDRGSVATVASGLEGILSFETHLQSYLWKLEPGLPMYPALPLEGVLKQETLRLDLAVHGTGPLQLSRPLTEAVEGGYRISDPATVVTVQAPGPEFGLVLAPATAEGQAHVVIESSGMPIYDSYYGEELRMDDEGRTGFVVTDPKLYRATRGLPSSFRSLTIRFPGSDKMPVLWFGVRAAQPWSRRG